MRWVTTSLDVLGLLLVAAGAGAGAWLLVGPVAFAVAGGVVLGGSWLTDRQIEAAAVPVPEVEDEVAGAYPAISIRGSGRRT